jgi:membrane protein required for colicin V production
MNIAHFNWVDFTILGILAFSTLISLARGFVQEAISLATWVLAIWVAYKYGHAFGQNVLTMVHSEQAKYVVGALALFILVLIAGALVNFIMSRFLFFTGLSVIDRILGIAFGFVRGILLVGVLLVVGELTQLDKNTWWGESQLIPQFSDLKDWLKSFIPEQFEKIKEKEGIQIPGADQIKIPEQSTPLFLPKATETIKQGAQGLMDTVRPSQPSTPVPVTPIAPPAAAPTVLAPNHASSP